MKKSQPPETRLTFYPCVPNSVPRQCFKEEVKPSPTVQRFTTLMDTIIAAGKPFTQSQILRDAKPYDLDPNEVKSLLAQWLEVFERRFCRITKVDGCYDNDPIYILN